MPMLTNMHTSSHGFASVAILLVVIALLAGAVGYVTLSQRTSNSEDMSVPSVGTPVNAAEQIKMIRTEKDAYLTGSTSASADFSASPTSGPSPLAVLFVTSHYAMPDASRYEIQFGDGQSAVIDGKRNHTYMQPGTYTAELIERHTCMIIGCTPPPPQVIGIATITVR